MILYLVPKPRVDEDAPDLDDDGMTYDKEPELNPDR